MEGWNNWGWQTDNKTNNAMILGWYNQIFVDIIGDVIQ